MRQTLFILIISIIFECGCTEKELDKFDNQSFSDIELLDFYSQYSSYTNPGEYVYLYEDLPDSLIELCRLIRSQIIHPFTELHSYQHLIPEERWDEYLDYTTVESILEGLVSYNTEGFISSREPQEKLILVCQQNAILLASILKYRGIPARVRCGHALYFMEGYHISHTICEVWNKNENRWMLVDPSLDMVDFSSEKFEFSYEPWLGLQKGEIDTSEFGIPGRYSGLASIVGKFSHDLAAILGIEYPIHYHAPIMNDVFETNQLSEEQAELLDTISELLKSVDAENFTKLQEIYNSNPEIQVTNIFY